MSNKRCVIIGGGPSINNVNLDLIKNEFCIGLNQAYKLGTFIDVWLFVDSDVFRDNRNAIERWPNRIVSCAKVAKPYKKVEYYDRCRQHILCDCPKKLSFPSRGANAGATAINFAVKEGFDEIILLGYDMKLIDGQANYHNDYKKQAQPEAYEKFMEVFYLMASELKVQVINANPDSALECFPKCTLESIYEKT